MSSYYTVYIIAVMLTDICAPDTPTPLVDFLLDMRSSGDISEEVFNKVAHGNASTILNL
jgi:hypothetical protein